MTTDTLIYFAWWAMGLGTFALGFAIGFGVGNKRCNDYWNNHLLPQLMAQRAASTPTFAHVSLAGKSPAFENLGELPPQGSSGK